MEEPQEIQKPLKLNAKYILLMNIFLGVVPKLMSWNSRHQKAKNHRIYVLHCVNWVNYVMPEVHI